jgi:hypothetical protein
MATLRDDGGAASGAVASCKDEAFRATSRNVWLEQLISSNNL